MSVDLSDIEKLEKCALGNMVQLSAEELSKTIRTIVEMENQLIRSTGHQLSRGSTSQMHRLIQELGNKNEALAEEICNWAIQYALNPYVPFGTCNADRVTANNLEEYRNLRAARATRQAERERQDQKHAVEQRTERIRRHAERRARHTKSNIQRRHVIDHFNRLGAVERLCIVARDNHHPLWFYPKQYAEVAPNDIGQIDSETRALLLKKLVRAPRGPWRQLRQMLLRTSGGDTELSHPLHPE